MTEPLLSLLADGGATSSADQATGLLRFGSRRVTRSLIVVSAHGEIDAANACILTEYVLANVMRCRGLVLDLSAVGFFGTEGFSDLHRVSVCCAHAGIGWAVVPGVAVWRLLRICDPHGTLPAADSVGAALTSLQEV
ncbi:MAG: hypothetical protein JWR37_2456 [Mycobacterium sp.]|jgi:anti-anti-sigma factor|nr:hypothetical protein [Mycobacterium sp.]